MGRWATFALNSTWGRTVVLAAVLSSGSAVVAVRHFSHTSPTRVLGEQFTTSASGNSTDGGASAKPAPGAGGSSGTGNNGNGLGNGGGAKLTFTFSASVNSLTPGADTTLPVVVSNPSSNNGTLTVNTIAVASNDVTDHGAVVCAGSNLQLGSYDSAAPGAASYVADRGGKVTVPLTLHFLDSHSADQTGCRGQTIPLTINGTGTVTR